MDDGVFWSVNYDKFHQHFQDKVFTHIPLQCRLSVVADVWKQAIVAAVRERLDETGACVMRSLLRMSTNFSEDKSMQTKSSPTVSSCHLFSLCYCTELLIPQKSLFYKNSFMNRCACVLLSLRVSNVAAC